VLLLLVLAAARCVRRGAAALGGEVVAMLDVAFRVDGRRSIGRRAVLLAVAVGD